ncbi:MAG: PIN domain-containing protein [Cyclobacteriaceae bacterium]|jgi:predicted nucleic acid-binding protein|nr:PIN domain-containing protein [Cyclobacteriaceae bacterium]NBP68570.1 PIN domain-containing protein [Cytophagia bacterium]NBW36054.1 PIN domain-containing protein [Cytophagia bacterium]
MTDSKIFFDSAPLIYLVEFNEVFYDKISLFMAESIANRKQMVTSVVSFAEFGVKPRKLGKKDVIDRFEKTITNLFDIQDVDLEVASIAAGLRAKYSSLRGMDALQVASAIRADADIFVTNDKRLKAIKEIKVILVKEL